MAPSKTRWALVVLAIVALTSACGDKAADDTGSGAPPTDSNSAPAATSGVTVSAINFAYDPREVEVAAGAEFEITFINKDEAPHTFTSGDLDVNVKADPGQTVTATATAPDSGFVTFHCEIHSSMMGTITVAGGTGAGAGGSNGGSGGGNKYDKGYTDDSGSTNDSDSGYGY
ncbi:MAG: Cupredoxin-like domain [Actinomycetota bacterium]|nr:Cupredoxin-like domain [Actinomycetota bacterium]